MQPSSPRTRKLTEGSEWRTIVLFSLPLMGSNLLQVAYTLVDSLVVANFVGASAFGAVNVSGPMVWIASSVAIGMGAGISILVSQYYGARRYDDIHSGVVTALGFCGLLGLGVCGLWLALARPVLGGLLAVPEALAADARAYFMVYSLGIPFQLMYNALGGVLRALGNARASIVTLAVAAVINLLLDLALVVLVPLGVVGAAAASVASQAGAAAVCLVMVLRTLAELPGRRGRFEAGRLRLLLRLCLPVTAAQVIHASGFLLLQRMVNSFGPASIEGFAAMGKTEEIIHVPVYAFQTALASFTGQNMGAGLVKRAERATRATMGIAVGVSVLIGALMLVFDERILLLYNISGDALLRGREHMDLMCLLLPVFTVNQVANGTLQGAGAVRITMVSSFAELASRLVITWGMIQFTSLSFRSIYASCPPTWLLACGISLVALLRGRWKTRRIT